jgi:hypothetical protein
MTSTSLKIRYLKWLFNTEYLDSLNTPNGELIWRYSMIIIIGDFSVMLNIKKALRPPQRDSIEPNTLYLVSPAPGYGLTIYMSNKTGTRIEKLSSGTQSMESFESNVIALRAGLTPGTLYETDGFVKVVKEDDTFELLGTPVFNNDVLERLVDGNLDTSWGSSVCPAKIRFTYNGLGYGVSLQKGASGPK